MLNVINNAFDVIVLILFFGLPIFVHEFGHFLAALKCGLVIKTFSIGFGPAIWKKKINGIVYKIGWIPFGGYVALPQIDPAGMSSIQDGAKEEKYPSVSCWKRIIVSVSGPIGNILLGLVLAWIVYLHPNSMTAQGGPVILDVIPGSEAYEAGLRSGDRLISVNGQKADNWYDYNVECILGRSETGEVVLKIERNEETISATVTAVEDEFKMVRVPGVGRFLEPYIGDVIEGGPAERAGLKKNDRVVEFNGVPIESWQQFVTVVSQSSGENEMIVKRGGKKISLKVTPEYSQKAEAYRIGALQAGDIPPWMLYKTPARQLKHDALAIWRFITALVTPGESQHVVKSAGGPMLIILSLWTQMQVSMLNAVGFLRFLNINLAILNLLPIPVLDGGHVLFAMWEAVTRKKPNARLVNIMVNACAVILLALMVLITFSDGRKIFNLHKLGFFGNKKDNEEKVITWDDFKGEADDESNENQKTDPADKGR